MYAARRLWLRRWHNTGKFIGAKIDSIDRKVLRNILAALIFIAGIALFLFGCYWLITAPGRRFDPASQEALRQALEHPCIRQSILSVRETDPNKIFSNYDLEAHEEACDRAVTQAQVLKKQAEVFK